MTDIGAKMRCGGCGCETFRIFNRAEKDGKGMREPGPDGLLVECTQCKSVSTLTVETPAIRVGWGDGASGILSTF